MKGPKAGGNDRKTLVFALLASTALIGLVIVGRRRRAAGRVEHSVTVVLPPDDVRRRWQDAAPGFLAQVPVRNGRSSVDDGLRISLSLAPAPGDRGTEIRLRGEGRRAVAESDRLRAEMRRLKSVLEAGESLTVEGQPAARGPIARRIMRVAARASWRKGRG